MTMIESNTVLCGSQRTAFATVGLHPRPSLLGAILEKRFNLNADFWRDPIPLKFLDE
jgi:hypothetical protein